jgi:hypothetical protein
MIGEVVDLLKVTNDTIISLCTAISMCRYITIYIVRKLDLVFKAAFLAREALTCKFCPFLRLAGY